MRLLLGELVEVLTEMQMLQGGSTSSVNTRITGDDGGRIGPSGDKHPLLDNYVGEAGELRLLVYKMQREVFKQKHSRKSAEDKEDRNARIVTAYVGWPAEKVAVYEELSTTQVRTIRKNHDRWERDGERRKAA